MRDSGVTKYRFVAPPALLFSRPDAADHIDAVQRRRCRWRSPGRARGLRRHRRPPGLGGRLGRDRSAPGSGGRDRRRHRCRLLQVPRHHLMLGTLFTTPRTEPGHLLPAAGGALVLALALPVVALLGWSVAGWGLAAALWVGLHVLDLVLARARTRTSLASSGMQGFGIFFKAISLLVV